MKENNLTIEVELNGLTQLKELLYLAIQQVEQLESTLKKIKTTKIEVNAQTIKKQL